MYEHEPTADRSVGIPFLTPFHGRHHYRPSSFNPLSSPCLSPNWVPTYFCFFFIFLFGSFLLLSLPLFPSRK